MANKKGGHFIYKHINLLTLSVLRFMDSDFPFGIFILSLNLEIDNEDRLKNETLQQKIVNFLFICSNNSSSTVIYRSDDTIFLNMWILDTLLLLTRKLLNQGFLMSPPWKCYSCHHYLVSHYGISVLQMTTDMFRLS